MENRIVKYPYGFIYHGVILRKWELPDGQAQVREDCPAPSLTSMGVKAEWHQVPLSFWDYSGYEIVEWELKEGK